MVYSENRLSLALDDVMARAIKVAVRVRSLRRLEHKL